MIPVVLPCQCTFHETGVTRCPAARELVEDYHYYLTLSKWRAAAEDIHDRWLDHYRRGFAQYHKEKGRGL